MNIRKHIHLMKILIKLVLKNVIEDVNMDIKKFQKDLVDIKNFLIFV